MVWFEVCLMGEVFLFLFYNLVITSAMKSVQTNN